MSKQEDDFYTGFKPMKLKVSPPPAKRANDAQRLDWLLQPQNRVVMHNLAQTNATADYLRKIIDQEMA
jgi:hypothetical protein